MKSSDVRKAFIDYFVSKGHEHVKSSSLIPRRDPTLLFTNAGMVQFKGVFTGQETRDRKRATTCQKCMRAGGKHSDIENVGHTARHHTFFEMLGNFSFGDYFKREAIQHAWELLTKVYKLPADKLYATVYEDDDEAITLWLENSDIPRERIIRLGAKDNFWQMADTGPCGPCSEILIDQGEAMGCGKADCKVGCDCDRYLELWNLVFMQYERDEKGDLKPLPKPSIDTGMGLERISAVLQGRESNFDSDVFSDIIASISRHTGVPYKKSAETDVSIRVIADHVRASTFLISDGLMPANDGRGYVLRRIIRRASRHARLLGVHEPMLFKIMDAVVSSMGDIYPELIEERERAQKVMKIEEERFSRTLEQGIRLLDAVLEAVRAKGSKVIPGDEIFKLYDTFGFPLDLVRDIANDSGLELDEKAFHVAMEAQRERARASWVGEEAAVSAIYKELHAELGNSVFLGYDTLESESVVKAIVKNGHVVKEAAIGEEVEVFLDATPFYGESGGQAGDTGVMYATGDKHIKLEVTATARPVDGLIAHTVRVSGAPLAVWSKMHAKVDDERRRNVMRNHTATHMLQAALRSVLGDHVKQAGSLVEPDRLRFDFTHFSGLDAAELRAVEDMVNEKVLENIGVSTSEQDSREAMASGAMALFGEKYGDKVRVVTVTDFSRELCGGTHVRATGEIGPFAILSEASVASGVRRIEAVTGWGTINKARREKAELQEIASLLKTTENPLQRVRALVEEAKQLQREQDKLKGAQMKDISVEIAEGAQDIGGVKVVARRVDGLEQKDLRELADNVRDRIASGVVVLASANDGQAAILATVTKDISATYSAGDILKAIAASCGGSGGGKPQMAQGGTKNIEKLDSALDSLYDMIRGRQK